MKGQRKEGPKVEINIFEIKKLKIDLNKKDKVCQNKNLIYDFLKVH